MPELAPARAAMAYLARRHTATTKSDVVPIALSSILQTCLLQVDRLQTSSWLRFVCGQEPSDLRQKSDRYRDDSLVIVLRCRNLVGRDPFLLGPTVKLGKQLLNTLLVPAFWEFLFLHRLRLLIRRRYAFNGFPVNG